MSEGWRRWQSGLFGRLDGDWSLAIWDGSLRRLFVARSPLSSHYCCLSERATSSVFGAAPALVAEQATVSPDGLIRHFGSDRLSGPATTLWEGVESVRPGTFVERWDGGRRTVRFWAPDPGSYSTRSDDQCAAELRELVTQNVVRALQGPGASASQLSGGRDSSVVSTLAGDILDHRGERLRAYTGAPGEDAMSIPEHPSDESSIAQSLARRHPAIDHVVVRSTRFGLCGALDRAHSVHHEPLINPIGMGWWNAVLVTAATDGNTRILTGEMGNLGLSAGGATAIGELVAGGGLAGWIRLARGWSGSWRTLLHQSAGPFVPPTAYRWAMGRADAPLPARDDRFFRGELRHRWLAAAATHDRRPTRSYRRSLARIAMGVDPAERISRDVHGIERIDPTCDPRLVEFALSLTPRQLAAPPNARPIFDRAFGDRLPKAVLRPEGRGLQSADYHRVIDPQELRSGMARYALVPQVRELIDTDAIMEAIDHWPQDAAQAARDYPLIAGRLLPAISLASFLAVHFSE